MYGMAQAVSDLIGQGAPAFDAAVPILSQLLKAEMAEREVRSIAYQIKAARLPAYKDLAGFDFASSEVNEALVRQLHRGEFIDGADNVVLIGGPGTGKTHMATALGIQAVEHHRRKARFFSTVDLVNMLEQEKAMNKAGQLAERLLRLDLVILDELGYLPFSPSGGALLFHLLSKLYEQTSVIITTNLSFSEMAGYQPHTRSAWGGLHQTGVRRSPLPQKRRVLISAKIDCPMRYATIRYAGARLDGGPVVDPQDRSSYELGHSMQGKSLIFWRKLERAKGFEPSTPTLARLCSTPELRPLWRRFRRRALRSRRGY